MPTHSRPSAVGMPPVMQPAPSSRRTVVRSGQKAGKGTMKFRTSKCCGDGGSVKPARLADGRETAVGADDEIRQRSREGRPLPSACTPTTRSPDRIRSRTARPHVELEGRVLAALLGEHAEDRRLRDEAGDEAQRTRSRAGPAAGLPGRSRSCGRSAWGSWRSRSPSPIWSKASMPLGCSPSPRKVRSKLECRSRSATSTPRRASRYASAAPAGPAPDDDDGVSPSLRRPRT